MKRPIWPSLCPRIARIRGCLYCGDGFLAINGAQYHCSEFCRFWSKVRYAEGDACWEFGGGKLKNGYGAFNDTGRAHRVSWEIANRMPVPEGMDICHSCDNPPCVRPSHLWPDTNQANRDDSRLKRRHGHGERNGRAKLTAAEVQVILTSPLNGQQLADKFGVYRSVVNRVRRGEGWKHIKRTVVTVIFLAFLPSLLDAARVQGRDIADTVSGAATVIDGDSLIIQNVHVRLWGVDAPETEQTCTDAEDRRYNCGLLASDVMTEETAGATVSCYRVATDQYGRMVGVCNSRGRDLGEVMVRRGFAVDYAYFSGGKYRGAELEARTERRGLWSGKFQNPRDWRKEHRP